MESEEAKVYKEMHAPIITLDGSTLDDSLSKNVNSFEENCQELESKISELNSKIDSELDECNCEMEQVLSIKQQLDQSVSDCRKNWQNLHEFPEAQSEATKINTLTQYKRSIDEAENRYQSIIDRFLASGDTAGGEKIQTLTPLLSSLIENESSQGENPPPGKLKPTPSVRERILLNLRPSRALSQDFRLRHYMRRKRLVVSVFLIALIIVTLVFVVVFLAVKLEQAKAREPAPEPEPTVTSRN